MEFRKGGQTVQRRRRVLRDENLADDDGKKDETGNRGRGKSPDGVREVSAYPTSTRANQPRIVDLIPARAWTLSVLLLLGLTAIAAIQSLYGQIFQWAEEFRAVPARAAHPWHAGSVMAWISSLWLVAAGVYGMLIYRLRREKTDDYRGRYRVWLWIPLVFYLAALCVGTGLHGDLVVLGNELAGNANRADFSFWGAVSFSAIVLLVSLRLAFEISSSRAAVMFLMLAVVSYLIAATPEMGFQLLADDLLATMAQSTTLLFGHLFALFAVVSYGRYVLLDVQGQIKHQLKVASTTKEQTAKAKSRRKKADSKKADAVDEEKEQRPETAATGDSKKSVNGPRAKTNAPSSKKVQSTSRKTAAKSSAAQSDKSAEESILDFGTESGERLSKSERRRLRKQQRRQQNRRAA